MEYEDCIECRHTYMVEDINTAGLCCDCEREREA